MAADLRQIKGYVTVETDAVLDCVAEASGKDRSELLREVMHKWALEYLQIHSLLGPRLKAEGLRGSAEVPSGTERDGGGRR